MSDTRRRLRLCPVCRAKPDQYEYESDAEQLRWGYPDTYRACRHCGTPLVEVGDGQCREFAIDIPR
jgi:hypothetical protein